MMPPMTDAQLEDTVESAREALRRNAWREAYDLLSAAEAALTAHDLEGLSRAAWFTGRLDESIAASERAFAAQLADGRNARAALVATWLAKDNFMKGASAVANAWIQRAAKLLSEEPESVELGYLERIRSVMAFEDAGDDEAALRHAERALDLATRFGDRDLLAMALQDRGRVLVDMGRYEEGMALLDEANLAAVSGELSPMTTGIVYCNTIVTCEHVADYGRASEWTDVARRWCERQAIGGFPGICRVHRAAIIRLRGAWSEAEAEARRAYEELSGFYVTGAAEAFYEIGQIRLRMGDLDGAEEAFDRANELGRDSQVGVGLLRLAQGRLDAAWSCVERALADEHRDLHRARILPSYVEIALAQAELDAAAAGAEELERIAERYSTTALRALATVSRGVVELARGDASAAAERLRQAARLWHQLEAPYEAACARLQLARAYRALGDVETAALEARAARSAFERLGAAPDALRCEEVAGPAVELARAVARTFMFTDISDSTGLVQAIGDEAWNDLVSWHDRTLRSLLNEHGGEEVDHAGDGFFVAFPDAARAVKCAVAIQRTLAEHRRGHGFAPRVRVGLHATEASQLGRAYRGKGVHEAARVAALAEGGEILATGETMAAAGSGFTVANARIVELKGIERPVEVVSVSWR